MPSHSIGGRRLVRQVVSRSKRVLPGAPDGPRRHRVEQGASRRGPRTTRTKPFWGGKDPNGRGGRGGILREGVDGQSSERRGVESGRVRETSDGKFNLKKETKAKQ